MIDFSLPGQKWLSPRSARTEPPAHDFMAVMAAVRVQFGDLHVGGSTNPPWDARDHAFAVLGNRDSSDSTCSTTPAGT